MSEFNPWVIEKIVKCGKYNYAVVRNHPRASKYGYVYHHRIVVENSIKRMIRDGEVIHHVNGNKKDNRVENLVLMTASEHTRMHNIENGFIVCDLVCPNCLKTFSREKRSTKESKGGVFTFCSRKCNGSYQRSIQMGKPRMGEGFKNVINFRVEKRDYNKCSRSSANRTTSS